MIAVRRQLCLDGVVADVEDDGLATQNEFEIHIAAQTRDPQTHVIVHRRVRSFLVDDTAVRKMRVWPARLSTVLAVP